VLVMLISSFMRLALYENAYGFSRLRTYTHFFIPWLGALLLATAALEVLRKRGFFTLALLISAFGFITTMGVMNVDGVIVRQNVERTLFAKELDYGYLLELSSDAVPEIYRLATDQSLSKPVRDVMAAHLACRAELLKKQEPNGWRSFNLSELRAREILTQKTELWKEISIRRGQYDNIEAVWENEVLDCYQLYRISINNE